ncbi:MAG: type I-E CRISPR-associated protein Cas6/Cse3/CasE [Streptosporangiaceae bacterium]
MTTWLTQITPDYRNDTARQDLRDVIKMHQRVMTLVPDGLGEHARLQAGVLYRVDQTSRSGQILVQTQMGPRLDRLPAGYGQAQTRELDPLLDWLHPGALVRYRIAANTCKRRSRSTQVIPLRGVEADQWWITRASRSGITLQSLIPCSLDDAVGGDRKSGVRHAVTRFDGIAAVTDPGALREALLAGVGRGKSHGCGLLSIAPLRAGTAAA